MDTRAGAIVTALQHIQLPPIMHPEQAVDNRHRPLPLEPFSSREAYVTAPNAGGGGVGVGGHYQQSQQQQQQQQQQEYQSTGSGGIQVQQQSRQQQLPSALSLAVVEHNRNQEFNEHLRKSLAGEGQRGGNNNDNNNNNGVNSGVVGGKMLLPSMSASSGGLISTDGKGGLLANNNSVFISNGNGNGISSTGGRLYPPILPWTDDVEQAISGMITIPKIQSSPPPQVQGAAGSGSVTGNGKGQKVRRKWTDQETKDLLTGCSIHGVGNWKRVLDDTRFNFNNRSSVDLKDRFRTCFPREYKKHFGRDKSEAPMTAGKASDLATILVEDPDLEFKQDMSNGKIKGRTRRRNSNSPTLDVAERLGFPNSFPKAPRRERKPFSHEEDEALLRGFQAYGPMWSKIQADKDLELGHRRSTDLRDRFRNAFPDKYTQAGFKAKPKHPPKPPRSCPTTGTSEELNIDPLDSTARNSPSLSSIEAQHQFETPTDVSGLEDFSLGPPSQLEGHHDHRSDDHSRKGGDSDFNVSIMQEFLGANSSMRDWDPDPDPDPEGGHHHHHHHHHHHNADSLFASSNSDGHDGRDSPSSSGVGVGVVVTSSMQEATLAEDFSARIFDQGDLFSADPPGQVGKEGGVGVEHNVFGKEGEERDGVGGGGVAHDLVRWEDMVTHPIFTLDTGPPAPGVGVGVGGVSLEMDGSVTLAPINPALLGGGSAGGVQSGEGVESVVPGLSALLEEISGGAGLGGGVGVGNGVSGPARTVAVPPVVRKRQNTGRRKRKDKAEEASWGEGEKGGYGGGVEKVGSAAGGAGGEKRRRMGGKKSTA